MKWIDQYWLNHNIKLIWISFKSIFNRIHRSPLFYNFSTPQIRAKYA